LVSGGLLLIGLAALGAWWVFSDRGKDATVAEADPTKPERDTRPVVNDRPKPDTAPQKSKDDTGKKPPLKLPPPIGWKVRVDPPQKQLKLPAEFTKDITGRSTEMEVVFPTAAGSPFVAVCNGDECQVWDLQTNAPAGKLVGPRFSAGPPVLAPDGAHLAFVPFGQKDIVEVKDLTSGQSIKLDIDFRVEVVDFAGPGKIVTAGRKGSALRVLVWDVATGKRERNFAGPELRDESSLRRDMLAISPGGAYLAVVTPGDLWVWDLKTGTAAGHRELEWNADNWLFPCSGLSFSPDGRELAALFQTKNRSYLVCWDVAQGTTPPVVYNFDPAPVTATTRTDYEQHVLSWVGQKRGWLLYGQMFIDRKDVNASPGAWPSGLSASHPPYRWMVGPDHVATLPDGQGRSKVLTIRRFDPDRPGE
jgi:WD40 repeat protein